MASDDVQPPADAFELLADETRVRILRALGDAWVDDWPGVLSYGALMDRSDGRRTAVLGPDLRVESLG